jgi:hypothetical protein
MGVTGEKIEPRANLTQADLAEALENPSEFLNKVFEVTEDAEGVKSYEIKNPEDLMGILLVGLLLGALDDLETDEP